MKSLVSIIITTCRGDWRLVRAIDSALEQSYKDIEVIVVDDNGRGSERQEYTQRLIHDYIEKGEVLYIAHGVNRNGAAARNTGVKYAKGTFLAFLDDDDFFTNDRIELLMAYIAEHDEVCGVVSDAVKFRKNTIREYIKSSAFTQRDILLNNSIMGTGSNLFLSKESYNEVDGFDESFIRYQDVEFMVRILDEHKIGYIPVATVAKDDNQNRFWPRYSSFRDVQSVYLNKFATQISRLGEDDMRKCISAARKDLILSAYYSGNKDDINESYALLQEACGELSTLEKISLHSRGFYLKNLVKITKPFRAVKVLINMIRSHMKMDKRHYQEFIYVIRKAS